MNFNTKNDDIQPTSFAEEAKDETLTNVELEVVDLLPMTPVLLKDTEASKATMSNLDHSVQAKNKSGICGIDASKTRESLDVSFDKKLNKEDLTETVHPSTMQNMKVDEPIQLARENPEVSSDLESERMDEDKDAICNSKHIKDAFVFCPLMG